VPRSQIIYFPRFSSSLLVNALGKGAPSGVGFDRLINAYNQEHPHE